MVGPKLVACNHFQKLHTFSLWSLQGIRQAIVSLVFRDASKLLQANSFKPRSAWPPVEKEKHEWGNQEEYKYDFSSRAIQSYGLLKLNIAHRDIFGCFHGLHIKRVNSKNDENWRIWLSKVTTEFPLALYKRNLEAHILWGSQRHANFMQKIVYERQDCQERAHHISLDFSSVFAPGV